MRINFLDNCRYTNYSKTEKAQPLFWLIVSHDQPQHQRSITEFLPDWLRIKSINATVIGQ